MNINSYTAGRNDGLANKAPRTFFRSAAYLAGYRSGLQVRMEQMLAAVGH